MDASAEFLDIFNIDDHSFVRPHKSRDYLDDIIFNDLDNSMQVLIKVFFKSTDT